MAEEKDKTIEEKVIEIITDQFGIDKTEIKLETSFTEDLNADSLDQVELVMEFEDKFDMKISDEDARKMQRVGDVVKYIKSYEKKQRPNTEYGAT